MLLLLLLVLLQKDARYSCFWAFGVGVVIAFGVFWPGWKPTPQTVARPHSFGLSLIETNEISKRPVNRCYLFLAAVIYRMKPATQVLQLMKNAILEARSKRASSSKKPRKAVSIKMRQEWTEEQAKSLLPPNSTIRRDPFNGRWQVFYGSGPAIERWSKSRSWGIAGGASLALGTRFWLRLE